MNKQQIKLILDNAPDGATHVDFNSHYWHNSSAGYWLCCDDGSRDCEGMIGNHIRKLSDLRTQLALIEENEKLKAQNERMRELFNQYDKADTLTPEFQLDVKILLKELSND